MPSPLPSGTAFSLRRTLPLLCALASAFVGIAASRALGQAAKEPKIEVLVEKYNDTGKQMERREIYRDKEGKAVNHGNYTFWFSNGNKSYEVPYADGLRHGKQINYHFSGGKSSEQTFNKGKQEGKEPAWDENGFMYRLFEYADDTPHGVWTWYYQRTDGKEQKVAELHWKQGTKEGPWGWWYENGQKGIEGQYRDHKQHGTWKYWDKDGTLTETRQYNDGELVKPPAK
jgi:antitoxin component YwqK of YwqJK toxin-antitoxin module